MTSRASFYVTRALIGAFEGGFIPGTILFATYFYKTKELSVRLAFFWSTLNVSFPLYYLMVLEMEKRERERCGIGANIRCVIQVARIVSSLLAAGILQMRGVEGKSGWFWLFLIDGLLTFVIGLVVCGSLSQGIQRGSIR